MEKSLATVTEANLTSVFTETATLRDGVRAFFEQLMKQNDFSFFSLFKNTGNAGEKEAIIYQTIRGMLKTGLPYNGLALSPDNGCGLANNSGALRWLENEKYVVVSDDRTKITLTDRMLGKLFDYADVPTSVSLLVTNAAPTVPRLGNT